MYVCTVSWKSGGGGTPLDVIDPRRDVTQKAHVSEYADTDDPFDGCQFVERGERGEEQL